MSIICLIYVTGPIYASGSSPVVNGATTGNNDPGAITIGAVDALKIYFVVLLKI
jgi:hypothetical protein